MKFPALSESAAGYATSVATGVTTLAGVAAAQSLGAPPESLVAPASVLGNLLGYSLDVLFAKAFPAGTTLAGKSAALLASFATPMFLRFLTTVCVDVLVNAVAVDFVRQYLEESGLAARSGLPDGVADGLVIFGVSAASFVLLINTLRFGWAYREPHDPVLSVVVGMSLATLMCAAMVYFRGRRAEKARAGGVFLSRPLALSATLV
jgi:hypothetical protein